VRGTTAITVNKPVAEVYRYWRNFENLPAFMAHLESVEILDQRRSRWTAKAPARQKVTWEAEITDDAKDAFIAWQSVDGSDMESSGWVRFRPAPAKQGTEVTVDLEYRPPGGKLGKLVAKLFGEEPIQQMKDDLRRFKQVMETGEVLRSDANPDGVNAKKLVAQREAQPA
jgi:uncharacterized membrane protein